MSESQCKIAWKIIYVIDIMNYRFKSVFVAILTSSLNKRQLIQGSSISQHTQLYHLHKKLIKHLGILLEPKWRCWLPITQLIPGRIKHNLKNETFCCFKRLWTLIHCWTWGIILYLGTMEIVKGWHTFIPPMKCHSHLFEGKGIDTIHFSWTSTKKQAKSSFVRYG